MVLLCSCVPCLAFGLFLSVSSLSFPLVRASVLLLSLERTCLIKMLPFS